MLLATPGAAVPNANTLLRLTRPRFLLVTVSACLIGWSAAWRTAGTLDGALAAITLLLALAAHAAGNILNDYEDHASGADAANTDGLFPFTGGSRLIQQGRIEARHVRTIALALIAGCTVGGLLLAIAVRPALLGIGLAGLGFAWAYSAPPLRLMARGIGEIVIAVEWWLVAVGACLLQLPDMSVPGWTAGLGHAGLVAAILLLNGFPDARGDTSAGKRTLVVRLGFHGAAWAFLALVLAAHGIGIAALHHAGVGGWAWPLASLPLSLTAAALLFRHLGQPARLRGAITCNILASLVHALATCAALVAS